MATRTADESTKRRAGVAQARVTPREVLIAARRHFDHGETLSAIAESMGISGSYLGRLLRSARENGWVRIEVAADPETELAAAIQHKYPHLVHVDVVQDGATPEATARAIGMAGARWLNALLERDEESGRNEIQNIAIGGAAPHAVIVEQTLPRKNRISVGPTALTPERGRVDRFTASTLSALLALKLGALGPGDRLPPPKERTGFRYAVAVDPPKTGLEELRAWFAALEKRADYQEVLKFWGRLDVAFVSAVGIDWPYSDVKARLDGYGVPPAELKTRGAIALAANQFVDVTGAAVPLAGGVPSYEPAIPIPYLHEMGSHTTQRNRFVVLDLRGSEAEQALPLVKSTIANVLLCDSRSAQRILHPG